MRQHIRVDPLCYSRQECANPWGIMWDQVTPEAMQKNAINSFREESIEARAGKPIRADLGSCLLQAHSVREDYRR